MRLLPYEAFLLPNVEKSNHEDSQEHHHLPEPEPAELPVEGGPRPHEDELDVEDDQEDGDGREPDREAALGKSDGILPALERLELDAREPFGCDQARNTQ